MLIIIYSYLSCTSWLGVVAWGRRHPQWYFSIGTNVPVVVLAGEIVYQGSLTVAFISPDSQRFSMLLLAQLWRDLVECHMEFSACLIEGPATMRTMPPLRSLLGAASGSGNRCSITCWIFIVWRCWFTYVSSIDQRPWGAKSSSHIHPNPLRWALWVLQSSESSMSWWISISS